MLITTQNALNDYCQSVQNVSFITVDTEFLREKTYFPKLCLIQMSDPGKNAVAIDVLADDLDLKPVYDLFQNQNIVKVFHAPRQDIEIFYNDTQIIPEPLYDTQIAAMVCGYGDQVGYNTLVQNITKTTLDKSSQFTDWSRRPLSDKQLTYALNDVTYLVDVYTHLTAKLEQENRTRWVVEEMAALADPDLYAITPDQAWERVKIKTSAPKILNMLKHLAAWREEFAMQTNVPKTWIMKDDTLTDLAFQAPGDENGLNKIRGLAKPYTKGAKAQKILQTIRAASDTPKDQWPQKSSKNKMPERYQAAYDILKFLLQNNARAHHVAPKLIAGKGDLQNLVQGKTADNPIMKGWRYDVFGKDAQALLNGEIAVTFKNGTIEVVQI